MQFLDEAKIFIKSGAGGDGCVAFRREKNIPFGGPNGGDGGRGGHVWLECVHGLNTLIDFRYQQHFKAKRGMHGMGQMRTGHKGEDLTIKLPAGTQVFAEDKETLLADLTEVGQKIRLLEGGHGGKGNAHFKSSTNQAPRKFSPGGEAQELWIWLRLKLLSDAGLIGLPNAGKSTFLAAVTRAKPKIADYPFTTLKPQLGVVYIDEKEFVLADIPGLIEGASQGVGLGLRFLGHVERCGVLLHLIDGTQENIIDAYHTVRTEIETYDDALAAKPEIVALNKCDALDESAAYEKQQALQNAIGQEVRLLSAAAHTGTDALLRELWQCIMAYREMQLESDAIDYPDKPDNDSF